ncbi:hypothetical protein [Turkeypox virus]|uniref:Uncharacterized protein n=1 Tax=Turkeypox virus TaxID=336486 RepID=A0A0M3ZEQ1_9POXV|nr:hypothetical protein ASN15_gp144 [Turkeypox virus]ALA62518.1 hypothetical protein [Turkeypox virus]
MNIIDIMKSIKGGHPITPNIVTRFSNIIDFNNVLRDPLFITLSHTVITDSKIKYSDKDVYNMLYTLYGYIPSVISKNEFISVLERIYIYPPENVIRRMFGNNDNVYTGIFIRKMLRELE